MTTAWTLQWLEPTEWERLRAIRLRALADSPDAFASTVADAARRSPDAWARQLLEMPTIVATADTADVGIVRCALDPDQPRTAWLLSMWVAPEARRMGLGRALVDAVVGWARRQPVDRLLLEVADTNEAAIALYASRGFLPNGISGTLPPPRSHLREHQRELPLSACR